MEGHKAEQVAETIFSVISSAGIDIKGCIGQSYDNARNMAGKYHSVRSLVREQNPLAIYIPCCGHSLNLVGKEAVRNVSEATAFFDFVTELVQFSQCIYIQMGGNERFPWGKSSCKIIKSNTLVSSGLCHQSTDTELFKRFNKH